MTIDEAKEFFHAHPQIMIKIDTLSWVGLGICWPTGNSAFWGEAQE